MRTSDLLRTLTALAGRLESVRNVATVEALINSNIEERVILTMAHTLIVETEQALREVAGE